MGFDPVTIISLYPKCWRDHALAISSVYLFNVDLDIRVLLLLQCKLDIWNIKQIKMYLDCDGV